jgi:DNA-directed RNA polymerase alpha subunit
MTRSAVGKQSASAAAASAVKAAKKKKKRKRRAASPPAVVTTSIPTSRSREVESEKEEEEEKEKDETIEELPISKRSARRSESPAAKRQQKLVQKTSEDALRRGLEAQRNAAAVQARMPAAIKPQVFWPKARLLALTR